MRAARSTYALCIRKATSTQSRTLPVEECPLGASHSPLRRRRLPPPSSYHWTVSTLTGLTAGGGCAAKYSASRLDELLRGFVPVEAENLLVGLSPADDAAVYKLDDERALVFTVDFFPPLVDDPDVRAHRGDECAERRVRDGRRAASGPLGCGLPGGTADRDARRDPRGRRRDGARRGWILAGGHTIRDSEPKYGLAVVGTVHPAAVWTKSNAQPGDALFLTKPIGTGLVLAAKGDIAGAVELMTTSNAAAAEALRPFLPNAVTDVTGFGLFGHAHEMADRSGVRIVLEDVPALDGALEAARGGVRTGGDRRNREYAAVEVDGTGGAARARLRRADGRWPPRVAPCGQVAVARVGIQRARSLPRARRPRRAGLRRARARAAVAACALP